MKSDQLFKTSLFPTMALAFAVLAPCACGVTITRLIPEEQDDGETTGRPDGAVDPGDAASTPDGGQPVDGGSPDLEGDIGDTASTTDMGTDTGPGVQLEGAWVARHQAIVFIHIGHSNMAGRAANPAELKPFFHEPHPQLWSYRARDPITATGPLMFRPAVEPLAEDMATQGRAGPGMALLRAGLAKGPDAHFISIGSGQSGATYGLCESYKKGGLFYEYTMRPARALRGKVTFGALFTMFGANEFWGADPQASGLAECLRQLASDVRADLGEPELPFMIGDFEMSAHGQYLPSLPGPAAVIAQLRMAVERIPRSARVPTENIPLEDDHHFNLLGHKLWAERGIQVLEDKGWAPWAQR